MASNNIVITDRHAWNQMNVTLTIIETSKHKLLRGIGLFIAKIGLRIAGFNRVIVE